MISPPEKLKLKSTARYISPFLVNNSPVECKVGCDGKTLHFASDNRAAGFELDDSTEPDTNVQIVVMPFATYGILSSDQLNYEKQLSEKKHQEDTERRRYNEARTAELEEDARRFNQKLGIPAKWVIDHKAVMSGLSSSGQGDGMNSRSVWHVRMLEPLSIGRFSRDAGDFLCGKDTSKHQGYSTPDAQDNNIYKVTCKACLKIAGRLKGTNHG